MDLLEYQPKDFSTWMGVKSCTQNKPHKKIFYKEGDIYWMSLGLNIGSEQDGKGKKYSRPVLIIKGFSSTLVWGIPLSTTKNRGPLYHAFQIDSKTSVALLSQLRSIDMARATSPRLIGHVSSVTIQNIKEKLKKLLT